ncbi:apolipoprotein D-like [Hyalella azteca]|uniref:Apolipoprotein D-like n=1 Tax=Hyalella azteca TaxID=294128 RepID=A0A8B7NJY7_HYAAZ|nr:apolipoprotein D-like [Hyalella azteca]
MKWSVLVLLGLLAAAKAEITAGICPEWTNVETFDIPSYLGRWYEMARLPVAFELGISCVTVDYGPLSDTMITVTNNGDLGNGIVTVEGTGTATNVTGQLMINLNGEDVGLYNVIDTDYVTYACVYTCEQLGDLKDETAWAFSRTTSYDPETRDKVEAAYTKFGIDVTKFHITPQGGDCVYAPLP